MTPSFLIPPSIFLKLLLVLANYRNLVDNGWTDNLAVLEPSKGMLETFNKNFPQIKNQILGSSYKIPLEDNSIDAVIIAQVSIGLLIWIV